MSAIVFSELVLYIEETWLVEGIAPETRLDEETAPVFKLADLVQLYQSKMEQLYTPQDLSIDYLPNFLTCRLTTKKEMS